MLMEYGAKIKNIKDENDRRSCYESLFIFAGMWAIGGPIGGG